MGGPPTPELARHRTARLAPRAERAVRVDLAIAYRLFDWLGITDLIHTHISVCVPDEHEQFLQLPYGHLFREARASNMVKCDVDGRIISDLTGLGISKGGFSIHSAIHMGKGRRGLRDACAQRGDARGRELSRRPAAAEPARAALLRKGGLLRLLRPLRRPRKNAQRYRERWATATC